MVFDEPPHPVDEYTKAWAKWTVDFACRNEYTGYSSVKRWKSRKPLGLEELIGGQEKQYSIFDEMKKNILDKLEAKYGRCPGLPAVPAGRRMSDSGWRKVRTDDD